MPQTPFVIALPIADRRTSFAFYRDGLGFAPVGEPAEDGVPEPLQFALNDGVRVMLVRGAASRTRDEVQRIATTIAQAFPPA